MARHIQKHARLLAVVEALDNGKTIRESRDADTALAVRHFYHTAGWAQLMGTEFAGQQPLGVVAQIIPWPACWRRRVAGCCAAVGNAGTHTNRGAIRLTHGAMGNGHRA